MKTHPTFFAFFTSPIIDTYKKGEIEMRKVETKEERKARLNMEFEANLNRLRDIVIDAHKSKRREWVKGYGAGLLTAVTGILAGNLLGKALNEKFR